MQRRSWCGGRALVHCSLATQLPAAKGRILLVKNSIRNVSGAAAVAFALLTLGGFASLSVWKHEVPRRERLENIKGTLLGFETKHSRYSSYEYLLIRINGREERLRLWACISELKRLPPQTEIDVLRMEGTLFEVARTGTMVCSYMHSAQALGAFQARNRAFIGSTLAVAAFLIALLAWTNWRTKRHLDKLVARRSLG